MEQWFLKYSLGTSGGPRALSQRSILGNIFTSLGLVIFWGLQEKQSKSAKPLTDRIRAIYETSSSYLEDILNLAFAGGNPSKALAWMFRVTLPQPLKVQP